jgi:hypothetical protein
MKNLSNNFINVDISTEKQCLYSAWKLTTENASWDDIRNGFENYFLKGITEYKPRFIVVDEREMRRPYGPEEQDWVDKNSAPVVLNAGVEKIAIIISKDGFVELSTESMMQEETSKELNTRFFDSIESAEEWLFN